jgi:GDPmannose 4,6-dehydratase
MWRMLQQDEADDYVVATGQAHSVLECVEVAFDHAGLSVEDRVEIDPSFMRPAEVERLVGDSSKARRVLGWEPRTGFEEMIRTMVEADYTLLSRGERSPAAGAEPLI